MSKIRILVADDHALMIGGILGVLATHYEILETVTNGRALTEAAQRLQPEAIVLDISMPLLNGVDAAVQIRAHLPGVKLVFLTMHSSPAYLSAALKAGANGYVLKSAAAEELLGAMEHVLQGGSYISPGLSTGLMERFPDASRAAESLQLSAREREVLQLIAEGRAAKEIAFVLNISTRTVNFHRENMKRKLGMTSAAELTRHAIQEGLI